MWGFAVDSAARHLCRGYRAALGAYPDACLNSGGVPALVVTMIAVLTVALVVMLLRRRSR